MEIYVMVANVKEKIKHLIRRDFAEKKKVEIMLDIQPFDPKEFRATQAFYYLLKNPSEVFQRHFQNLIYRNYFFKLELVQRLKHDAIIDKIKALDKDIKFTIENDEDFESLPEFTFIIENFLADDINTTLLESPSKSSPLIIKGCKCAKGECNKASNCCPKLVGEKFAYKSDRQGNPILSFKKFEKIVECGKFCKCGPNCINRVSQKPSTVPLCLYKTENRGWGLKATTKIKQGTFILEYRGELLGHHEAGKRTENQYLFDLNMDRASNGFYTIDANFYSSLGRFVNHSCEPNAKMWFINDSIQEPKSQKLCIFADRDIKADEEISIDYSPRDCVPVDRLNSSHSHVVECLCGTKSCRGNIY